MARKGSCTGEGKATAMAQILTSVINRCPSLDWDQMKGFISEHIGELIWIYNVCGVKDEREWDHFFDVIILDSVMTRHFLQFPLMGRTTGADVRLSGNGGQPSAHIWG